MIEFERMNTNGTDFYIDKKLHIDIEAKNAFVNISFILSIDQLVNLEICNKQICINHVSDILPIDLDGINKVAITVLKNVDDLIKCIRITSLDLNYSWYIDVDLEFFTKRLYMKHITYGVDCMYFDDGIAYVPKDRSQDAYHPIQKCVFRPSVIDNYLRITECF